MMCMVDDGERASVYNAWTRKARKAHVCDECGRSIAPGETYECVSMICDGNAFNCKTCAHCKVAQRWLAKQCGGFIHESVWDDIREHMSEYPGLGDPLAALVAGAERQWALESGGLMPVPALPPSIDINEHA